MSKVLIVKSAAAAQSPSFAPTVSGGGNAAMQMNLPAGKGVTGYGRIVPALGAAWGALNTLADDSQGDLFSSMGQAGMRGYTGYQAASQALGPAQRYAQQFTPAGRVAAAKQGLQNSQLSIHDSNTSGNTTNVPQAPTLGMDSQSDWMDFMDSTAGSTSGNVHQNNFEAETGKNATEKMLDRASMITGQKSKDATQIALDEAENTEAQKKLMGDVALKSRRPWSYY